MKKLLYKEFRLSVQPQAYFLILLGALLLIPEYPYFIAFMYVFITIPIIFVVCKEYKDIYFTALLPVRKRDIVKARFMSIIAIELAQILFAVPFAFINKALYPQGNPAMLDVNLALFGFVFIIYAIFNLIFLPGVYKRANKTFLPTALGVIAAILFGALVECLLWFVPAFKLFFDTPGVLNGQILTLTAGIILYAAANLLAYRKAAAYFEKTDV